jgi:thiosulfate sulfurtransferase
MPYKRISVAQAKELIDRGGVTVGDVRDPDSYASSHIQGALHVQHETLDEFLRLAPKDKPLILYCYHGNSSQGAANYFDGLGFEDVYSVDGGYEAWRSKY